MFEKLKTFLSVAYDVIRGRALVETLHPRKRNKVRLEIIRADGTRELLSAGCNSRVNSGANWQASLMGSAAGTPANYMALSTATLSPALTDTSLTGEITSGTNAGLARTQATYQNYTAPTTLGGPASYQLQHTFTSSATATVNSAALFNASSSGTMFVEANLSPSATLASGDQIVLTWSVQI